jgi:hypothetical protein
LRDLAPRSGRKSPSCAGTWPTIWANPVQFLFAAQRDSGAGAWQQRQHKCTLLCAPDLPTLAVPGARPPRPAAYAEVGCIGGASSPRAPGHQSPPQQLEVLRHLNKAARPRPSSATHRGRLGSGASAAHHHRTAGQPAQPLAERDGVACVRVGSR